MNNYLKFSWGHIICFLALILISYITFLGTSYLTGGDFVVAAIVMLVVSLLLCVVFIGAQMLKASAHHFRRFIVIERFLIFISPFVFLSVMLPCFHFASVYSKNDLVVQHFEKATSASIQLFADYDSYAQKRIENYTKMLDKVIADDNESMKLACGFSSPYEQIQKQNMIKSLRLQLQPNSYLQLKEDALVWIKKATNGVSTWNVFMMGNTREIKQAINQWSCQLNEMTIHKLCNEEFQGMNKVLAFSPQSKGLKMIEEELSMVDQTFTTFSLPSMGPLLGGFVLYLALLLPYLIQDRHSKSCYTLLRRGKENQYFEYNGITEEDRQLEETNEEEKEETQCVLTSTSESHPKIKDEGNSTFE